MGAELPVVLVNATACTVGGGVQVAAGFLRHLAAARGLPFSPVLAVSREVAAECDPASLGFPFWVAEGRPGALLAGRSTRRALREFASSRKARAVFTVFGPSYVRFDIPELAGFADGFAFARGDCYRRHPLAQRLKATLLKPAKLRFLRGCKAFWVETEEAKVQLARALRVPEASVSVVPNALNPAVRDLATGRPPASPPMLLALAAGYWHKNHEIIPPMAREMARLMPGQDFRINLTLPPESPIWAKVGRQALALGVADKVRNLGPLSLAGCAAAIEDATAVLHPSLLETFSATYLEAMGLGRPLLASDRPFARGICGEAALYFDPLDPAAAAAAAVRLIQDADLRAGLVRLGAERLRDFPTPERKNDHLVRIIADFLHDIR